MDKTQDIQLVKFTQNSKYESLSIDFEDREIYIDKSTIGKTDKEKLNYNFLAVGRHNDEAKKLIITLSNHKFYLVGHKSGISLFRKYIDEGSFIRNFQSKNILSWNDTFYTLEKPTVKATIDNRLLVVFSSVSDLPFNASIEKRMFFKNYDSVTKYIPKNTYVLRIADIGGVLGGFYLNSNADMLFEDKVQKLIRKIQLEYTIPDFNTVLYGSSKGGTGAIYHGIKMGLKTLTVDPILSDAYYIDKYNDLHFVQGVFPMSKQDKFTALFRQYANNDLSHIKLVTSPNSEQFSVISQMILLENLNFCTYIFNNPNIKKHTDIGINTLNFTTSMLNNLLYNIDTKNSLLTSY